MENNESKEPTNISSPGSQSSSITPIHTDRKVIQYVLFEGDLDYASSLNIFAMACFSVGSALLSLAAAVWLDMFIGGDTLVEAMQYSLEWIKNILLFLGAVFYLAGGISAIFKYTKIKRIKKDSIIK